MSFGERLAIAVAVCVLLGLTLGIGLTALGYSPTAIAMIAGLAGGSTGFLISIILKGHK